MKVRILTGNSDDRDKKVLIVYFTIFKAEYFKWYRRLKRFFQKY